MLGMYNANDEIVAPQNILELDEPSQTTPVPMFVQISQIHSVFDNNEVCWRKERTNKGTK
jgi:hypothetical protein